MEFKNKVEVRFPGIEECFLVANSDCAMGKVYDYSCALKTFALQRMQQEEKDEKAKTEESKKECKPKCSKED
jgi:hypothetical protein